MTFSDCMNLPDATTEMEWTSPQNTHGESNLPLFS